MLDDIGQIFDASVLNTADTIAVAIAIVMTIYMLVLLIPDAYLMAARRTSGTPPVVSPARPRRHAETRPLVAVQLAIYNEPTLAIGAIRALAALAWPRDRLDLMVLDDSTDDTTTQIQAEIAALQEQGIPIRLIRRSHRTEYKAGALRQSLAWTDAQYIAIFDVDYRPDPDFLARMMPALLANPEAGFAQARLTYHNRDQNWLTRAQAIELDMHADFDQRLRAESGLPWFFNGTCGIWRRAAIEAAGGWSGRSLVEDQDLSYRAFTLGWTGCRVDDVRVAGELPSDLRALKCQRQRWAAGSSQMLRFVPTGLFARLSVLQSCIFGIGILAHGTLVFTIAAFVLLAAATAAAGLPHAWLVAALLGAALTLLFWTKNICAALAILHTGRRPDLGFAADIVAMWAMELRLLASNGRAQIKGLLRANLKFKRTPKLGDAAAKPEIRAAYVSTYPAE